MVNRTRYPIESIYDLLFTIYEIFDSLFTKILRHLQLSTVVNTLKFDFVH
jgi:hypothetical protein